MVNKAVSVKLNSLYYFHLERAKVDVQNMAIFTLFNIGHFVIIFFGLWKSAIQNSEHLNVGGG